VEILPDRVDVQRARELADALAAASKLSPEDIRWLNDQDHSTAGPESD
jgi:hypothetical protein